MSSSKKVFDRLNKLNIKYDMVEHPPAETTEEADKMCIRDRKLMKFI